MKSQLTKQQIIPLAIGLIIQSMLLIFKHHFPLPDLLYGLLEGLSIGLMAFSLLFKRKNACNKAATD